MTPMSLPEALYSGIIYHVNSHKSSVFVFFNIALVV